MKTRCAVSVLVGAQLVCFAQSLPPADPPAAVAAVPQPPSASDLGRNFLRDQKAIWTSPFRIKRGQAANLIGFTAITAALIATDRRTADALPNTPTQARVGRSVSLAILSGVPAIGGLFIAGRRLHDDRMTETAFLAFESVLDTFAVTQAVKLATRRQRPYQDSGHGRFWSGGYSFPSGHSMISFGMAEVFASEYHEKPLVRIGAYSLATAVSLSRVAARKHFFSDVFVGSTAGLLIGRYVWQTHHGVSRKWSLTPSFGYDPRLRGYTVSLNWQFAR